MRQKHDLTRRLTRYFILSTLVPFLLIVILSASFVTNYYTREILYITDSYADAIGREASLYVNQLKQILITPNWSESASKMLRDLNDVDKVTHMQKSAFEEMMGSLISAIRYTGNDFYSAIITNGNAEIYSASNYTDASVIPDYDWKGEDWYQSALEAPSKVHFVPRHNPQYYDHNDGIERLSIVSTVRNIITNQPYAVMKLDFLPEKLLTHIDLEAISVPAAVYIKDTDGNPIAWSFTTPKMKDILVSYAAESIAPKSSVAIEDNIEGTPYIMTVLLDKGAISMKSARIYIIGLVLYIIALGTALYLNRRFSRRVTSPIENMKNVLSHVENGDFSMRVEHKDGWELEALGTSINEMTENLEQTINQKYVAQIAQKDAENRALLSQIQPHFLFNTLNTMVGLLYQEKYTELEEDLYSLSDILRNVLRKDMYTTISDEMAFLNDYMTLQTSRFEERLAYEFSVAEDTKDVMLPRLIVQPFVENSIIHGMEPSLEKCHVKVTTKRDGKTVEIIVEDDGIGFDTEKVDIMSSIGISNSKERLSLLYPDSWIKVESAPGKGCRVTIGFRTGDDNENIDR